MFLFRGADNAAVTKEDPQAKVANVNDLITHRRKNFDVDVTVLCKLSKLIFGPTGCTPNLHSLHHMIRYLLEMKGHPSFEMIIERLVSVVNIMLINSFQRYHVLACQNCFIHADGDDERACPWKHIFKTI